MSKPSPSMAVETLLPRLWRRAKQKEMSIISIPISDEDLIFLRRLTHEQGVTVEDFMAQHAKNLRLNLEAALHPDVIAATGVFKNGIDPQIDYYEHQERKHR